MAILDTAAGRAADNRRGWVANNGRHPVERNSLRGGREAGLRRMQRCSPALIAMEQLMPMDLDPNIFFECHEILFRRPLLKKICAAAIPPAA
jgi:hypothetical protein